MKSSAVEQILCSEINERMKEFFQSCRRKIIYGAGNQAQAVFEILKNLRIPVEYLVSRDGKEQDLAFKETYLFSKDGVNLEHYKIDEVPKPDRSDCDVLIAVNERHNLDIRKNLERHSFQHIYWCDSWRAFNVTARNTILNQYLEERIPGYKCDSPIIEYGDFRIMGLGKQSEAYTGMLASCFYDLVAPAIFQDRSRLTEGPYEWGNVRLEKGDVVLDLGANIGAFSCVAASKGCYVYAFEPTPYTMTLLERNQSLYGGSFKVVPYAVGGQNGAVPFYCNTTKDDINLTKNSVHFEHKGAEEIVVPLVSIDSFVEQERLERLDFIKANIEGAERDMLKGARNALRRFAPKLALCTDHRTDDGVAMERLILDANPNYVIEHRWKKLYAYVPGKL